MNPEETQSIIRSALLYALGAAAAALVTKGVMTSDQASALVPEAATVLLGIGGIALAWWGKRSHSAPAIVAAVNSDSAPGVKVVAKDGPGLQVIVTPAGAVKVDKAALPPLMPKAG